ncbi:S10 family peptidase [Gluconobacter morbifer]|uniref:Peptidase S10 serine carboxypeptidase n=1 Tax=Gluconobacter morbifer G707 TaxID=1088869 RepID=G6XHK1_9PROT|nr:peptidase S10 [Gluconobacter morbifer]EHH69659.1 peptidase S10 serine carboxypeptidase [Gluconobacter morbifer G707]
MTLTRFFRPTRLAACFLTATSLSLAGMAQAEPAPPMVHSPETATQVLTTPQKAVSDGTVTIRGQHIAYQAVAGTLIVHATGWDDAATETGDAKDGKKNLDAAASIFYVAYFKKGEHPANRPITFVYNGGPGSSSVWMHMGAFGPHRIVTADDTHTPAAPYRLIDNNDSPLDATDLVFIDAPGTGFGRLTGKDKEKAFYGTDPDASAFTNFITQFLARFGRYNSPKYLFGESYGTTRSAIIADQLASEKGIDLNGVMLLSQILDYDNSIDSAQSNPSMDQPYVLALPSFAATAWYHHKLPEQHPDLKAFLAEVEHFALTDYTSALQDGTAITTEKFEQTAQKLHQYTGLPVDYLKKANLRVNGGEFAKTLLGDEDMDTGRLDSRFSGPSLDPLSQRPGYDPQSAAMSSAYVAAFNDYSRNVLHYGNSPAFDNGYEEYKVSAHSIGKWAFVHRQPGSSRLGRGAPNVLPDLAEAMKLNPNLKVMLNQGYYDLGTPFFEGIYEMRHLPIPRSLASNIEIHQYESGHMVYAHTPALAELHDNVVNFISRTHS